VRGPKMPIDSTTISMLVAMKCENAFRAEVLEKESNQEACEDCRKATPGIDKPDRAGPDPGWEKARPDRHAESRTGDYWKA